MILFFKKGVTMDYDPKEFVLTSPPEEIGVEEEEKQEDEVPLEDNSEQGELF